MFCPRCGDRVIADLAAASRGYLCLPCWGGRKSSPPVGSHEGMALDSPEYRRWWLAQRGT